MKMPSDAWWSALWDSGALAMAILGPARTPVAANAAFCRLFATDHATVTAWPPDWAGYPLDRDVELDAFVRLDGGMAAVAYRRRFRTAQDDGILADVRLCAGPDGHILQLVLPVAATTAGEADLLARRLDQIGAALSHDGLEPPRQIGVQAGLLLERGGDQLDARARQALAGIERAAVKTGRRLRGLASFARLGLPRIDPAPLPLRPLIDAAWSARRARAPDAQLVVAMAEDLRWRCDPEQLTAALGELLANALAAAAPAQVPQVRLTVTSGREGCAFSVEDDGCGVAAADQPRLFRLFANRNEDEGGGVGLALVREVAEGHGGRVTLAGGPGQGARVTLILPR